MRNWQLLRKGGWSQNDDGEPVVTKEGLCGREEIQTLERVGGGRRTQ